VRPQEAIDGKWSWDEPVVIGVDTSAGLGADAQAMALVGWRTGRLLATYRDPALPLPRWPALVIGTANRCDTAALVIESNGVGQTTWQSCLGHPKAEEQVSGNSDGEVVDRRDSLRAEIEAKVFAVGGHLEQELQSAAVSVKQTPSGRRVVFSGSDDAINALSFARKWIKGNPWRERPADEKPGHYYIRKKRKRVNENW
jgi:hypothetical protein